MGSVIVIQVISLLRQSDRIEDLLEAEKYWFEKYLKEKEEKEKYQEIIENIKENLQF